MVGPLQRAPGGYTHLLVAINKFTEWNEAKPVATITAAKAKEFFQDIVVRFGVPNRIITDNGTQFTGVEFKDWCEELGIKICYTSVAYPQSKEQVERANAMVSKASSQGCSIGSDHMRENGPKYFHQCFGLLGQVLAKQSVSLPSS